MKTPCKHVILLALAAPLVSAAEPYKPAENVAAARAFVQMLVREDFAAAVKTFDETMTKAMPVDKLEKTWKDLIGQVGPFKKQLDTRTAQIAPYDLVFVICEFEKEKLDVRVVFDKKKRIAGLFFQPAKKPHEFKPPPYARRDEFTEKDVVIGEGGEWPLPGTLTLPKGNGPFAAVVLVHGSGSHDRDETIGPNKPFRDLAWGLAAQGVAVLRYEKRTHQHSDKLVGRHDKITIQEECIEDTLAAAALLRKEEKIDGKRIFIAGHSLGAIVAPRIGTLDPALAGLVLLSGSPRPLEDIILEQITYITSLKGELTTDDKEGLDKLREQVALVKSNELKADTPKSDLPLGIPPAYWLALRAYDAGPTAAKLNMPILVLQGERDYQVTMTDFAAWKKALDGRPNVRFKSYPRLNHLYLEGEGKSTAAEYEKAGHVAKEVVDDIAAWVKKRN